MQAPAAPAAEALGAIDQPRGDTQFTSNTDYQKELQGLIEGRGGLKSLLPGVSPAPSNDKVGVPADLQGHPSSCRGAMLLIEQHRGLDRSHCCRGHSLAPSRPVWGSFLWVTFSQKHGPMAVFLQAACKCTASSSVPHQCPYPGRTPTTCLTKQSSSWPARCGRQCRMLPTAWWKRRSQRHRRLPSSCPAHVSPAVGSVVVP